MVLEVPTFAGVQCNSDKNNVNNIIGINTLKQACTQHTHTDTHTQVDTVHICAHVVLLPGVRGHPQPLGALAAQEVPSTIQRDRSILSGEESSNAFSRAVNAPVTPGVLSTPVSRVDPAGGSIQKTSGALHGPPANMHCHTETHMEDHTHSLSW